MLERRTIEQKRTPADVAKIRRFHTKTVSAASASQPVVHDDITQTLRHVATTSLSTAVRRCPSEGRSNELHALNDQDSTRRLWPSTSLLHATVAAELWYTRRRVGARAHCSHAMKSDVFWEKISAALLSEAR